MYTTGRWVAVPVLLTIGLIGARGTFVAAARPADAPLGPMCAPPKASQAEPAGDAPDRPDWLLREHRYVDLVRWMATAGATGTTPALTMQYFRGVLANKQNQNLTSIEQLAPLLSHLDPVHDSARAVTVLKTLADDYTKTYRYADAARTLARLDREHGAAMTAADREDLRSEIALRRALGHAPAQQVTVAAPFAVPLRPDTLGLREVEVRVGRDSSGWIFDTGANLSTITDGMARRLGLHVISTAARTMGITGVGVATRLAVIPELRVGTAIVRNAVAIVLPDKSLDIPQLHFQITAILGYPVIEALGRLTIGADSVAVDPVAGEAPSDSSNLFLDALSPLVAATVEDTTRLFHFDSGADATMLTVRFCRAYSSLLTGLAPTHIGVGGAGGAQRYEGYQLAGLPLTIGGTRDVLDSVFVFREASKSPFEDYYGNLSAKVAARFGGYTLDFRAMTFRLGAGAQ